MSYTNNRIAGFLSLACFFVIFVCIYILISTPGASHYEISIYEEYPWYFWWMIIFIICAGQTVLLYSAFFPEVRSLSTHAAFLATIIASAILVFIPFIRGYSVYGTGDPMAHIGYIKDILDTGYYGKNFYPMLHIFCASITMLTGIIPSKYTVIIPPIFSLFFIFSFYILYKSIFSNYNQVLVGIAFSSILVLENGNVALSPNGESFLILPFILYVFLKRLGKINRMEYSILIIFCTFLITLYHPLIAMLLVIVLLVFDASYYISRKFINDMSGLKFRSSIYIIIIIISIFYIWDDYKSLILYRVENIYLFLTGQSLSMHSNLNEYSSSLEKANLSMIDFFRTAFDMFGLFLVTSTASVVCIIYVIKMFKSNDKDLNFTHVFTSIEALTFLSFALLLFLAPIGFSFIRVLDMEILFFLILGPITIYYMIKLEANSRRRIISVLILVAILMFPLTYSSVFCVYESPRVRVGGQHVPDGNLIGMERFFEIRNEDILTLEYGLSQTRYSYAIYGFNRTPKNIIDYESDIFKKKLYLPDHFGYDNETLLGSYYDSPRYLLLTLYSRISWARIYPEFKDKWKYVPSDFNMLENDNSVNKIYANSDLEAYLVDT